MQGLHFPLHLPRNLLFDLPIDLLGIAALLFAAGLVGLTVRRYLIQRRGGTIDLSMRLRSGRHGGGWALGVGRYDEDRLLWYRVFSLAPRPRRALPRQTIRIERQRRPSGAESPRLLAGSVVLECSSRPTADGRDEQPVEIAIHEAALPGFLAWLESAPGRGPRIT